MLSTVLQQLEPVSDAPIYGPLIGVAGNQLL